jgi:zinc transporter
VTDDQAGREFVRDDVGVLWAYQLWPDAPAQPLEPRAAQQWLANPQAEGFLWLHLNLSNNAALPWLRGGTELPDAFDEALASGTRSTRIERDEEALIGVVNDVPTSPPTPPRCGCWPSRACSSPAAASRCAPSIGCAPR